VAKGIYYSILNSCLVLEHKGELLEIIKPAGMLGIELFLGVDVPKRIMIDKEDKFGMNQVMAPMLNCLDHGIQLQFVGGIPTFSLIKLLAEECNRMALLT